MTRITPDDFARLFPGFAADRTLVEQMLEPARVKNVEAGTHLYWEGDDCSVIAFVLEGGVRVYRCGETGREITLYEIGPGETCILNASCILGSQPYPANAVTRETTRLVLVPAGLFYRLLGSSETLRSFVFALLSHRLSGVMELVHEVAFGRMDERLLEYLIEKSSGNLLEATHQRIANDLGTSREVVSRLLKDLERRGMIELSRNRVRLLQAG